MIEFLFVLFILLFNNASSKPMNQLGTDMKKFQNSKYVASIIYEYNRYFQENNFDMMFRNGNTKDSMTSAEVCPVQLDLLWVTDVGASIHSTPVIYPLFRDGVKTVL